MLNFRGNRSKETDGIVLSESLPRNHSILEKSSSLISVTLSLPLHAPVRSTRLCDRQ